MKLSRWCLVLTLARALAAPPAPPAVVVQVDPDHADGLYHVGETAVFTLGVQRHQQPLATGRLSWQLSNDGVGDLGRGQADYHGQSVKVEAKATGPSVLRLTVTWQDGAERFVGLGGAAFDPRQILPSAEPPADFDAWWAQQRQLLAAVPVNAQLTPVAKYDTAKVSVAQLTLGNIDGSLVHGWFCRPKAPGKYPAILSVPGAAVSAVGPASWLAERGFLSVNISVHDQPLDREPAFYDQLRTGSLAGYPVLGRQSRDTYYFRRVFLSFVRCIDYLTAQPDWNGQTVLVNGSSQGGGSALVAGGLDSRVTMVFSNVPALCDHQGLLHNRPSGWPRIIQNAQDQAGITTAGYFDAAFFARRIKVPLTVVVGLIDTTCPATTGLAAFNASPSTDKQVLILPKLPHAVPPEYTAALNKAITALGGGK